MSGKRLGRTSQAIYMLRRMTHPAAQGMFDRGSDGGESCLPCPSACVTAVPGASQNE